MYDNLLYIHENNILGKIDQDYQNLKDILNDFYKNEYLPMRKKVLALTFDNDHKKDFETATNIFNEYYNKLIDYRKKYNIKSQSKWDSTFLEEISSYLFKDVKEIKNNEYGIFNKKVYAGLKINNDKKIEILTKDVDFCIGKKVKVSISGQKEVDLILPIVAVEVKTYLDATMFGEVKSSSKAIRSASPNSKTYVLMGHKELSDEHLIAARQDSTLSEIFVLQKNENAPFDYFTIYEYWKEITESLNNITGNDIISVPGRILRP
jgi:hypothetical protein